ncbi:MAG TPA: HEPN domain-containing protein [Thermoanaerobaculia bacterium]|nr:HEPN domain-containing protein [Thermoanaerobaculia bacterium]
MVQGWLIKAQHDLDTARKLAQDPGPLLDTAIYHCQQAAEKAVKGFLAFHDQAVVKTHDVRFLVNQALAFEPGFEEWFEAAECVTPYATAYRYPDEILEPEKEEFETARDAAAGIVAFVLRVLPEEVHPGVETRERLGEPAPNGTDGMEEDAGGEEPPL